MNKLFLLAAGGFLLVFSSCKKEEKEKPNPFPATVEITGSIGLPTANAMVSTADETFLVQLATLGRNSAGLKGEIQIVGLTTFDGAGKLTDNVPPHGVLIGDPDFKTCLAVDKATNRSVSVTSSYYNDSVTELALKLFTINGKSLLINRVEKPAKHIEVSKVTVLSTGYLITGTTYNNGDRDVYMAKYDKSLVKKWEKIFSGSFNDGGMDAVDLCNGEIGVLAYTYSLGKGDRDILYLKLDGISGNVIFAFTYGTDGYEEPQRIIMDSKCRVYIAGHTSGFGHPEHNAYIICLDIFGNLVWENNYGTPHHDGFQAITLLPDKKGLLAAGRSMQGTSGQEDLFIQAVDFDGNPLWSKTYGDPNQTEIPVDIITNKEFYFVLSNRIDAAGKFSAVFVKDKLQ